MSRYQKVLITQKTPEQLQTELRAALQSFGYKEVEAAEHVWRKGGSFSNPLFVRYDVMPGALTLEAWVRFVLFPGLYVGEYDLEGLLLVVQKKALKQHVAKLEMLAS